MRKTKSAASKDPNNSILNQTPLTPSILNHNSNSCSNDTNCSTISNQASQNPVVQKELKIRSLLKELQVHVKKCQEEREKSEPNLVNINKTHEKIKKEEKLTSFYRKKLKSFYATTLKESENEIKCLRQALDTINQVRLTQNEIRLLQQQLHVISSPSSLLNSSPTISLHMSHNLEGLSPTQTMYKKLSTTTMRRGVLMSILQQAALTLPLWVGEIDQSAPALCGANPSESNYICKPGDKVAAIVKNNNTATTNSSSGSDKNANLVDEDAEEENWILAEVVAYHSGTGKYDVDDIDAEEGQERHTLSKKRIVPLPLWRANPLTDPDAIFPKDSCVLALYPQTTCFYRGIVSESPQTPLEDYSILFEDNTYPEGYSPPLNVPQLYVVADRSLKK